MLMFWTSQRHKNCLQISGSSVIRLRPSMDCSWAPSVPEGKQVPSSYIVRTYKSLSILEKLYEHCPRQQGILSMVTHHVPIKLWNNIQTTIYIRPGRIGKLATWSLMKYDDDVQELNAREWRLSLPGTFVSYTIDLDFPQLIRKWVAECSRSPEYWWSWRKKWAVQAASRIVLRLFSQNIEDFRSPLNASSFVQLKHHVVVQICCKTHRKSDRLIVQDIRHLQRIQTEHSKAVASVLASLSRSYTSQLERSHLSHPNLHTHFSLQKSAVMSPVFEYKTQIRFHDGWGGAVKRNFRCT